MSVVILYGTETGTSELVADAIADVLAADVLAADVRATDVLVTAHDPAIYDMSEFAVADLDPADFLVVVCSTSGSGDLPMGAEPFADELEALAPDLSGLRFAVFGLGDMVYGETFNLGGELMAEKLVARGATQVGEHARHDNSSGIRPSVMAAQWARNLIPVIDPANV
ncbi:flavodoxin domain-containing protein [Gordonia sp. DT30]|uniref:flavodoxin domain-containing protein n=1 Tax=unclassified Gordonia (in: high G+C Gram-positive bacteria) TaxID=2657482 RepID=UPI003CF07583